MKQVEVIAVIFVVIATFAVTAEGLQCWKGFNKPRPYGFKSECPGSCTTIDIGEGFKRYGCSNTKQPDGCRKVGEFNRTYCYCNKPLCNELDQYDHDVLQFVNDNWN